MHQTKLTGLNRTELRGERAEDDEGDALPPPPGAHSSYASDLPGPPRRSEGVSHRDDDLPGPPSGGGRGGAALSREEQDEKSKRDEIRDDRKRERERERRLEAKNQAGSKKSKITRCASGCNLLNFVSQRGFGL
jgi:SNW domain-containing protein 1